MRGAAATLGGCKLAALAGRLEQLARQGDLNDPLTHMVMVRNILAQTLQELSALAA